MKERVNTSLSFLSDYWHESIKPKIKKGWKKVDIFRRGVDNIDAEEAEKKNDNNIDTQ